MRITDGKPSTDPAFYKPLLDYLFHTFGEDKLIFGSDWPNGPAADNLPTIVQIVRDYFTPKVRQRSKSTSGKTRWRHIDGSGATPGSRNSPAAPRTSVLLASGSRFRPQTTRMRKHYPITVSKLRVHLQRGGAGLPAE